MNWIENFNKYSSESQNFASECASAHSLSKSTAVIIVICRFLIFGPSYKDMIGELFRNKRSFFTCILLLCEMMNIIIQWTDPLSAFSYQIIQFFGTLFQVKAKQQHCFHGGNFTPDLKNLEPQRNNNVKEHISLFLRLHNACFYQ